IDLRRVGHRAGNGQLAVEQIHQAALHGADLGLQARRRDFTLALHEAGQALLLDLDRKSTRLNSSHVKISYAVFCLRKKIASPDSVLIRLVLPTTFFQVLTPRPFSEHRPPNPVTASAPNHCSA